MSRHSEVEFPRNEREIASMMTNDLRIVMVGAGKEWAGAVAPVGERWTVEYEATGEEGIRVCLDPSINRPRCAVLGNSLPDMTTLEFLARLSDGAGAPRVPVILLIDFADQVIEARRALSRGAQDYLFSDGLTLAPLVDTARKAAARFAAFEEVHARRVALEWKNQRLRSLIDRVPNLIGILDRERRFRYVNQAVRNVFDKSPQDLVGKTTLEIGLREDLETLWNQRIDEVFGEDHEVMFEFSLEANRELGKNWYQVRLTPDRDTMGTLEGIIVVATEVTILMEADKKILHGEEHLRRVIDTLSALVGVLTPEGILVEANRPALALAGLRPEDVLGKPFEETYWWSYAQEPQDRLREAIRKAREGESSQFDVDVRVGNDQFVTIDFMLAPLIDDQGRVTHLIPSAIDITDRKRTEKAMRELVDLEQSRANELHTLLRATPAAIWMTHDKDCTKIFGNPAADRLLRIEEEKIPSTNGADSILKARGTREYRNGYPLAPLKLPLRTATRGVEVVDEELTIRFSDGEERHIYGNATPLYDVHGEISGAIAAFIDITRLKRTEETLSVNEERFQLATEAVNGLIYDWDGKTNLVSRSGALFDLVGYHPDEADPSPAWWIERIHSDDLAATNAHHMRSIAARAPVQSTEYRIRHRDGSWRHVWDRCRIVYNADGLPIRIVGYSLDVTDRVLKEQAYHQSEQKLRKLANSNVIGIVFGNVDGSLTYINDSLLRLIGYTREEFEQTRMGWIDVTPPEWLAVDRARIAEAQNGNPSGPYEKEYFRKDGSRVPILVGFTLLSENADETVAFVLDLTEQKRAEKALHDADRRKDEFLAMLAHELRNPLAAISTAAHILQTKEPRESDLIWSRAVITRQVKHLSRLIDDLLDVSRITTGKIKLKVSTVDVRTVITQAAESLDAMMSQRKHGLQIVLPPHPLLIQGDSSRIDQIVSNLLNNAAKFTDEGGTISISGGREGDWIVIRVRDNGIGISSDACAHIFDMYTQLDPNPDHAHGGLGIGLALVRSLAMMHGGSVEVASEGIGKGSEFTVRFPVMTESSPIAPPSASRWETPAVTPNQQHPTCRVLVVDDNPDIAMGVSRMLEGAGHEVKMAFDGKNALRVAEEFLPDCILLDIGLPIVDGYEVAKAIRTTQPSPHPIFIAISGYGQKGPQAMSGDHVFDRHLVKPVEPAVLLPLIKRRGSV